MKKRPLCVACLILILFICLSRAAGFPIFGEPRLPKSWPEKLESGISAQVTGTIVSREQKSRSVQYILKDCTVAFQNRSASVPRILLVSKNQPTLPAGTQLTVYGKLSYPESPGNPGQFDSRSYWACQKVFLTLWEYDRRILRRGGGWRETTLQIRERAVQMESSLMSPEGAGILSAMVLGDRSLLEDDTRLNFQMSGVIHILCISGLHLMVLGMAVFRLCQRLFFFLRPKTGKFLAVLFAAALLGWYGIFTGGSVSALRAFLMFLVYLGALLLKRTYDTLSALSLAAILLLLSNPGYLFSVGFLLSFSAVLGTSILLPLLHACLPPILKQFTHAKKGTPTAFTGSLLSSLLSWCSVTLVLLPLSAWYFYEIPLLGLPANLLLLPFTSFLLMGGIIGILAGTVCPPLGAVLLYPIDRCLRLSSLFTGWLRRLPGSSVICGQPSLLQLFLYYALLLFFCYSLFQRTHKKRNKWHRLLVLLPALAVLLLFLRADPPLSLTMLDVGQGDCLVLRQRCGSVFLCDAGSSSENQVGTYRILPYLKQQGIRKVECCFLSHADEDHINGAEEVLEAIADRKTSLRIQTLAMPTWMRTDDKGVRLSRLAKAAGTEVLWLEKGDCLRTESLLDPKHPLYIQVLHPFSVEGEQSGNAGSMVLLVKYKNFSALLTGDLEGEGEEELLPLVSHCDYLKVAHHGSRYSTSRRFLQKLSPSVCAISAPAQSRYGHPHQQTLDRIREAGADVFVTRDCGAIRAITDGKKVRVQTFRACSGQTNSS